MDAEWKTPEILEAEAQVGRSAEAARELVEKIAREGLPSLPVSEPEKPKPVRDEDDGEDNIVLRDSSW